MRIDDAPHRIALGIALGVFAGVFPGAGPIFALILAFIFRANKAAAVLGAVSVNTWISFFILIPAVKLGAVIFGVKWSELKENYYQLKDNFRWGDLFKESARDVLLPVTAGFFLCAAALAAFAYFLSYFLIRNYRKIKERRAEKFGFIPRRKQQPGEK